MIEKNKTQNASILLGCSEPNKISLTQLVARIVVTVAKASGGPAN